MEQSVNKRILGQVGFWALVMLLLPLFITGGKLPPEMISRGIRALLGITIFITFNLKFLFPRFYIRGNIRQYIVVSVLTLIVMVVLINIGQYLFPKDMLLPQIATLEHRPIQIMRTIGPVFPMLVVMLTSTLIEIYIIAAKSSKEAAQLKSEKLEAELKFLKSQINPHFLFNSLNNIYTLTHINPKSAGDSLLKLSEMLRYLLYECDAEKVPLGRELTYLKNYIALFNLKDEEELNIKFDATDVNEQVMIAPLLFIPFIENAFKHSQIEDLDNGWIEIALFGDEEQVFFEVKNSIPDVDFSKDGVGGIGLQNVKRQLELLYPNRHSLEIERKEKEFNIGLKVILNEKF